MIFRLHVHVTLFVCFSLCCFSTVYAAGGNVKGKVTETMDASGYTYVELDTGSEKIWGAAPTTAINVGDHIEFSTDMPMRNFHSKSLNRTFPELYFAPRFISNLNNMTSGIATTPKNIKSKPSIPALKEIAKAKDGYTIADIYNDKSNLVGKTIKVRGQVTRFTTNVMNKNWLHIIDGSGEHDLTITTTNTVAIDDVVVISGKLALDKDFGYGYIYPLIVEQALISKD